MAIGYEATSAVCNESGMVQKAEAGISA